MSSEAAGGQRQSILVVEDDPAMLIALRDILEGAGYRVSTASNGQAALELMAAEKPALILSDISMPIMDGIGLFEAVRKLPGGTAIPFVFLTARGTREDIFAGKKLGADDYITKPVTSHELLAAVRARLQRTGEMMLEQQRTAWKASLHVLASAIEARDGSPWTYEHIDRVNAYAQAMAADLGWSYDLREALEFGAILHDIGKIAVRESILSKTGPLSPGEWKEMHQHPRVGGRMLERIPQIAAAVQVVLYHHERWDGSGYPDGLVGEAIPPGARLLSVADAFDAMTSERPYHPAYPAEVATEEVLRQAGHQFDPVMAEAFRRCWDRGEIQRVLGRRT